MEVLENKKNMLLNREEIVATLQAEITPSKSEIAKAIAIKLKKHEGQIVVEKIEGKFGDHEFIIKAKVYDDIESKDKYETVTRKEKKKRAEEAKKKEAEANAQSNKKSEEVKEATETSE